MKKLLVFTAYYSPEVASSLYLCENLYNDLAKKDIKIELFTPIPSRGVSDEVRRIFKKKKYESNINGNLIIHRVFLMKEYKNKILRLLRYIAMNIVFIFKSLFVKADAIFVQSTPPTQGAMAAIIKKVKKIPFIYNVQDVFPDSIVLMGITTDKSMIYRLGLFIEKFTYRNANKIIVISNDMKNNLIKKGVSEEKIEVVSNWVDTSIVKPIKKDTNYLFDKYNLNMDNFYVVYAGNLGHAQDINVILNAAKNLIHYQQIQFIIFGAGAMEDYYKKKASEMNLKNLIFLPLQSYDKVSFVYSLADVSIVTCKQGFGKSAMPSKTWNIMATATPIIANFDENTDMEYIIKKYKLGLFNKSGDVDLLSNNIFKMYSDRLTWQNYGINAKKYVDNNVSRNVCTQKYYSIILSVFD